MPNKPNANRVTVEFCNLTERKAAHIIERDGYKATGYVMMNEQGEVCIVNKSAVRWLSKDAYWALMFPNEAAASSLAPEKQ